MTRKLYYDCKINARHGSNVYNLAKSIANLSIKSYNSNSINSLHVLSISSWKLRDTNSIVQKNFGQPSSKISGTWSTWQKKGVFANTSFRSDLFLGEKIEFWNFPAFSTKLKTNERFELWCCLLNSVSTVDSVFQARKVWDTKMFAQSDIDHYIWCACMIEQHSLLFVYRSIATTE